MILTAYGDYELNRSIKDDQGCNMETFPAARKRRPCQHPAGFGIHLADKIHIPVQRVWPCQHPDGFGVYLLPEIKYMYRPRVVGQHGAAVLSSWHGFMVVVGWGQLATLAVYVVKMQ